jgi:hypothetical protein
MAQYNHDNMVERRVDDGDDSVAGEAKVGADDGGRNGNKVN